MIKKKAKVIYIIGPSRSGSTLLSNILGSINTFFNAGELIDIWDRSIKSDGLCSCGLPFSKCRIWQKIIVKAFGNKNKINLEKMINCRDEVAHSSHLLKNYFKFNENLPAHPEIHDYIKNLEQLYRAIQDVSNCKLIVDSSKNVGYASLLRRVDNIDPFFVHLTRDPRASAYSWMKMKEGLWRINPVKSTLIWVIRSIASEIYSKKVGGKYIRIRYEDFVKKPKQTIDLIQKKVKENIFKPPFINSYEIKFKTSHSLYGNPDRFKKGKIHIELDERWKKMRLRYKIMVTFMTFPFLIRYNYRLLT